ncbi:hypothetical protein [Ramlibacter sp.]|uniref:hypothetical protein n=1 Tax=Ramlibacter sp. TaxID=1917967 RepID=UPI002BCBD157|nr:hypothetical protein [Ramlibacter sp.]HWI83305.1 hypothetical protein [Ramlibacter sp.]
MPDRIFEDPSLPPPGRRSGAGSASILPYLLHSLASRPKVPAVAEGVKPQRERGTRSRAGGGPRDA